MEILLVKDFLLNYAMPKNNKWICREWEFDIADTNFKEDDFERINLLKKYGNLLNPKIQVSLTEKKVRICQKRISHKSLEEFKGVKAANEIVKVFSELTLHKIVHGDLCASNIGFDKYGRLLIFDWEPFLKIRSPNSNVLELRSSKYALHPMDQASNCITIRSDLFATGTLLMQALYGRYPGLKLIKRNFNLISKISEDTLNPQHSIQKMFSFAKGIH